MKIQPPKTLPALKRKEEESTAQRLTVTTAITMWMASVQVIVSSSFRRMSTKEIVGVI